MDNQSKTDAQFHKIIFGFVPLVVLLCICPVAFANSDGIYGLLVVSFLSLLGVGLLAFGLITGKIKLLG